MICSRPARLNQRRRLRVVDDHEFGIQRQLLAIHLVVGEKNIEVSLTGMVRRAMQCVVKCLGYFKKILAAAHHFPFDVQVQFFRQRDQASEDFRYAAANALHVNG